jgi:hypothetical protein
MPFGRVHVYLGEKRVDLQPWMAQLGLGGAAVALFLTVGKSYINYIGRQVQEMRVSHREEIERLTQSWEARLEDARRAATTWETTANRWQEAASEDRAQVGKLMAMNETTVALLTALREEQMRR